MDLLVGITEPIVLGTFDIPKHAEEANHQQHQIWRYFIPTSNNFFFRITIFPYVLISLERAFALIWLLRHRVASTKGSIYSVIFAWIAGTSVGALILLGGHDILSFVHSTDVFGCTVVLFLITMCVSYLSIQTRLNLRFSAINAAHNR